MADKIPDNIDDIIEQYRMKIKDWFLDCLDYEPGADLYPDVQAVYPYDDGGVPERRPRYPAIAAQLRDVCERQCSKMDKKITYWTNIQLELKTYREDLSNQIIILRTQEDKIFDSLKGQWGNRKPVVENPLVPTNSDEEKKYRLFLNQLRFVWEEYKRRAQPIIQEVKIFRNLTIGNRLIDQLFAFCRDELAELEYLSELFIPGFNIKISEDAIFRKSLDELQMLVRELIKRHYILECDAKLLANMLAAPMSAQKEGTVHWCTEQSKLYALIVILKKYEVFPKSNIFTWIVDRFFYSFEDNSHYFKYKTFRSLKVPENSKPYKEVQSLLKPIFAEN